MYLATYSESTRRVGVIGQYATENDAIEDHRNDTMLWPGENREEWIAHANYVMSLRDRTSAHNLKTARRVLDYLR